MARLELVLVGSPVRGGVGIVVLRERARGDQRNTSRPRPGRRHRRSAFADDPAFRIFFPDGASYAEQAGIFVGHLFDRRVARGTVWLVDGGASVSMWDSPPVPGTAAEQPPPLDLPAEVIARLDAFDAAVHAWLPGTPYWYLGIVATHPAYGGRGWGRAAMAAGVERAATAGLPAYLETANPRNVELYRRAGWAVTRSGGHPIADHPDAEDLDHVPSAIRRSASR